MFGEHRVRHHLLPGHMTRGAALLRDGTDLRAPPRTWHVARDASPFERRSLGRDIGIRIVARCTTEAAIGFIKATAEDQPLTWETNGIRGLLDRPDRLEIPILRRRPVAHSAHLHLRESIQTAWVKDSLIRPGPSLHGGYVLSARPMAPLATYTHVVPGGSRLIGRRPGRMASQTLNSFVLPQRPSQALGDGMRRELRRTRREIEPLRGCIPAQAAFSQGTVAQMSDGRNSFNSTPEGPFQYQAVLGRTGSRDQGKAFVRYTAQGQIRPRATIQHLERNV
jgi:hypothetical protein